MTAMPRDKHDMSGLLSLVGGRARRVLADLGVDTTQKLVDLTMSQVLSAHSSGTRTWEDIRRIQKIARRELPKDGGADEPPPSPGPAGHEDLRPIPDECRRSFDGIVRYWLSSSLNAERTVRIMEMRFGTATGHAATLEECAASEGLTRERVRQIQVRAVEKLRRPAVVAKMLEFWASVVRCLEDTGGIISLGELGAMLCDEYQWPVTPGPDVLAGILDFCPVFHVSGRCVIGKDQMECLDCAVVRSALGRAMDRYAEFPVTQASDVLLQCCKECASPTANPPRGFSSAFISQLLQSTEALHDKMRLHDGILYSIDEWTLRFGPLYLAAAIVLKRIGKAMHFSEVAEELQRIREDDIAERGIHASLDRCEDVMLWDRGAFIHTDHVSVPQELLEEVETWLVGELRNGLPCISVSGVFAPYADECRRVGMISESALYACLRLSGNDALAYPRYPYIYLRRRGGEHVPAYLIVEDWLRDAEGPVPNKRLKEFVCSEMGMKPFQLAHIKKELPNVVQNDAWEYLHTTALTFGKDDVAPLVSYAQRLLSHAASVSAAKIFQDKAVTCHQMGISGPRMLFNVLREFASDGLNCNGYPTVKAQTKQEAGKWRGVVGDVEAFVKAQGRPCSSDELSEEFVEKLGYRPSTVFSVLYRGNAFRYLEVCLVGGDHRDSRCN